MRFVALALILLSLPAFVALLNSRQDRRDLALAAIGALMFFGGKIQTDAAFVSWPLWTGAIRGILISPVDTLSLALILTRRRSLDRLPFFPVIGLYAIPLVLSLAFATVWMATAFSIWQYLRVIVLFVALAGEMARPGALLNFMAGISLGLMVQAGYVIQQKLSGVVQAPGTMIHQNLTGMMVELAILPLIAAVLEGAKRKLIYLGVLAGLIVLAGGGSRAAMGLVLGGIVMLAILSLVRRSTPHKLKIIGLGAAAMVVVVPLGMATLKERFGDKPLATQEEERAAFKKAAKAMAADHPFGVGANLYVTVANLQGYSQRAGVAWNVGNRSAPAHNAYLLARAETGWLGEGAFIVLLVVPILAGFRAAFADRKSATGGVVLGASVALATFAIHNNFEFNAFDYYVQGLMFANFAVIAGMIRARRLPRGNGRVKRPAPSPGRVDREPSVGAPRLTRGLPLS